MSTSEKNVVELDPVQREFLMDSDKHALDLMKARLSVALANAEKALAQNEAVRMAYENLILKFTMKYSLKEKDIINEHGEIVRERSE